MTEGRDRYVVRRGEQPGQWQVYDTSVDALVYGAESMTEVAAAGYARRLNDAYARVQVARGSSKCL
jgi:hypothetical protein